jgi:hypothetical protein
MPIVVTCECGKRFNVKDEFAGKRGKCPVCGHILVVPAPEATIPVEEEPEPEAAPPPVQKVRREPTVARRADTAAPRRAEPAATANASVSVAIYWLFLLAFIPLGFSLFEKDKDELPRRLADTFTQVPEASRPKLERILNSEKATLDDLLDVLPEGRLDGAFLPRKTMMHWLFAFLAAGAFLGVILLLFPTGNAQVGHMLLVGLFTATVGVCFLFIVQTIAMWTEGNPRRGRLAVRPRCA